MHSSVIRTVRCSDRLRGGGGVSARRGACLGGVCLGIGCLPGEWGVSSQGVYTSPPCGQTDACQMNDMLI